MAIDAMDWVPRHPRSVSQGTQKSSQTVGDLNNRQPARGFVGQLTQKMLAAEKLTFQATVQMMLT